MGYKQTPEQSKMIKDAYKKQFHDLALKALKNRSMTPQGLYAHLSVYEKVDISVDKARKILNELTELGHVTKKAGHGSARSEYWLTPKK